MTFRILLFVCLVFAAEAAQAKVLADYIFEVRRSGSPIGTHRVTVEATDAGEKVTVAIDLKVTVAGIPVYRYTHRGQERWNGGVLQEITTTTNDDGDSFKIHGSRGDNGFSVTVNDKAPVILSGTIVPTSYWNKAIVLGATVLDSQDGSALDLKAAAEPSSYGVGKKQIPATRYRLRGSVPIDLWYTENGTWIGLEFERDGSVIAYHLKNQSQLPESLDGIGVTR